MCPVKIVVTGIGVVTAAGIGKKAFLDCLRSGKSGVAPITRFDTGEFPVKIAAEVTCSVSVTDDNANYAERHIRFALATVEEAVRDAEIDSMLYNNSRAAVIISSSKGGPAALEVEFEGLRRDTKVSSLFLQNFLPCFPSSYVAQKLGINGPVHNIVSACSSGIYSIEYGCSLIRDGAVDVAIVGATEAPIVPIMVAGYSNMGVLSMTGMRPFDRQRDGFVLGEGAGAIVIESENHASRRNVRRYGEIAGCYCGCDSFHITRFSMEKMSLASGMSKVLNMSGTEIEEVDYISAHGASTVEGDRYETRNIKRALGRSAYGVSISSIKAMTGHMLGASGMVEVIAGLLAMNNRFVPPTLNYYQKDPECDLDYTPNQAVNKDVKVTMCISMGFGGSIGILVMKK
jgi:3-oxoacyl-[acyl-carrier-protein] synthase II